MKTYAVKDVFDTVQGEGTRAGCRSIFVRFAGCNLWDGNPDHRNVGKGACAKWCDTDFANGTPVDAKKLEHMMSAFWPRPSDSSNGQYVERWCVLTGGEPLLQVDEDLLDLLQESGWMVAIETNGTIEPKFQLDMVDLLTCSPKRGGELALTFCDELKVVLPGSTEIPWADEELLALAKKLKHPVTCFVQPMDPIDPSVVQSSYLHPRSGEEVNGKATYSANAARCVEFVRAHPEWRVGMQLHKYLRVP